MNIACKTTLSCNLLQKSSAGIHAVFFTTLTENSPSFLRKRRKQTDRYSGFIQNVSHTSFGCPSVKPCNFWILFCIFSKPAFQWCVESINLDSTSPSLVKIIVSFSYFDNLICFSPSIFI